MPSLEQFYYSPSGYRGQTRFCNAAGRAFRRLIAACALLAATLALPGHASAELRILGFGDSLMAGYGLPPGDGFTDQLQRVLEEDGIAAEVINAGVSGDTSAGGLSRLGWSLSENPDAVILELGANDGLRGTDPAETRRNLDAILTQLDERDLPVLLVGMLAPPNLGADYGNEFKAVFGELAEKHGTLFYPFFLDGVAGTPKLNQPDGIHPTREGVAIIVERILPQVKKLIAEAKTRD